MTVAGVTGENTKQLPRWLADIERLLPIRAQFVLSGNIRDVFLIGQTDGAILAPLLSCLWEFLKGKGYEFLIVYDRTDGLRVHPGDSATQAKATELLQLTLQDGVMPSSLDTVLQVSRRLTAIRNVRAALLIDSASRLTSTPQTPDTAEYKFFAGMEKLSLTANAVSLRSSDGSSVGAPLFNPIVWLLNRAQDIPSWYRIDSERTSAIVVQTPAYEIRHAAAEVLAPLYLRFSDSNEAQRSAFATQFANETDGMSLQTMVDICNR